MLVVSDAGQISNMAQRDRYCRSTSILSQTHRNSTILNKKIHLNLPLGLFWRWGVGLDLKGAETTECSGGIARRSEEGEPCAGSKFN